MRSPCDVAVAIPVRNEVARLPGLLRALAAQHAPARPTVCLLFDNCTDGSQSVVQAMAPTLPFPLVTANRIGSGPPNVGHARAGACALALDQEPALALMTTDADSEPGSDWLAANMAALARAPVVAGRVRVKSDAVCPSYERVVRYYDRLHDWRRALDPVAWEDADTHHWTSAASLAMRPGAYRSLGGFAPLARGEDADLIDRAWRAGMAVRRDGRAVVWTSARRSGRVDGGFATMLASMDEGTASTRVAHPADEGWRYRHHALSRRCFDDGAFRDLAVSLRTDVADLERVAAEVPNADAFAARVVGAPAGGIRSVSLDHAEVALDSFRADRLEGAA